MSCTTSPFRFGMLAKQASHVERVNRDRRQGCDQSHEEVCVSGGTLEA